MKIIDSENIISYELVDLKVVCYQLEDFTTLSKLIMKLEKSKAVKLIIDGSNYSSKDINVINFEDIKSEINDFVKDKIKYMLLSNLMKSNENMFKSMLNIRETFEKVELNAPDSGIKCIEKIANNGLEQHLPLNTNGFNIDTYLMQLQFDHGIELDSDVAKIINCNLNIEANKEKVNIVILSEHTSNVIVKWLSNYRTNSTTYFIVNNEMNMNNDYENFAYIIPNKNIETTVCEESSTHQYAFKNSTANQIEFQNQEVKMLINEKNNLISSIFFKKQTFLNTEKSFN